MEETRSPFPRRSFLRKAGTQITILGAAASAAIPAVAQSAQSAQWTPKRHEQDDWLDQIPGVHRLVFDTTLPSGMSSALTFATNYYLANQSSYGLQNSDLATIIIARHFSTPFAFNDSIWAKYGDPISNFIDKSKEPAKTNAYARQITALVGRGVHFAVCQLATRALAGSIARAMSVNQDEVFKEISANLVPNSHLVAAGIVAVGRAQERGYALVNGG